MHGRGRAGAARAEPPAGRLLRPAQDVPKVLKGKALPALLATGRVMGAYGATFAAIGGLFAAVDVRASAARRAGAAEP